ncbi:MAG: hypothetical protein Q8R55_05185 [Candidatus Taylorbacteria bacterium]|nr:hypothetical protein [Candidatus Taylorbacteria bacterium]
MLPKLLDKIKSFQYHIFLAICIALISFISFNLGKISSNEKGSIKVTGDANIYKAVTTEEVESINTAVTPTATPQPLDMRVVASKKSKSKLYHFAWCPGYKQIKEENKLWFNNEQEAVQTGYKLAGNCSK